jgi:carbon-monoxide dehydrogenase iron sulfur subunit
MENFGLSNQEKREELEKRAITRRTFLIAAGTGVAGVVVGGVAGHEILPRVLRTGLPQDLMPSVWLGRNLQDCTGCKLCEMACSMVKEQRVWPWASRIRVYQYPPSLEFPVACYQCGTDAKCIHSCPEGALSLSSDTCTVEVDTTKCLRTTQQLDCRICADACPGGTINHHPVTGAPLFCDMCGGDPACVRVCPSDTLTRNGMAMAAALPDEIAQQIADEYELPTSSKTG